MITTAENQTVQAGLLGSMLGADLYRRLAAKYGHAVLWQAFSDASKTLAMPGLGWRLWLYRLVRRWRMRCERLQVWLERAD